MPKIVPLNTYQDPLVSMDSPQKISAPSGDTALLLLFSSLRDALKAYNENPLSADRQIAFRLASTNAAAGIATLSKRSIDSPIIKETRELLRQVYAHVADDIPVSPEDLQLAKDYAVEGWPGLLAAMLIVPASQWSDAPLLSAVPEWLWGDYTTWLFTRPTAFARAGLLDNDASNKIRHLQELNRWVQRNPGSACVKAAAEAYLSATSDSTAPASRLTSRLQAELHGAILTRVLTRQSEPHETEILPRTGRKLRVGFIAEEFGHQTAAKELLPLFSELDLEQFEVSTFALRDPENTFESRCHKNGHSFQLLPSTTEHQLITLSDAHLDVLVFHSAQVTKSLSPLTRLALHRNAPLQVVKLGVTISSGLPGIDLAVASDRCIPQDAPEHFTERVGALRGLPPVYAIAPAAETGLRFSRQDLGLADNALIFISIVTAAGISRETCSAWAQILAALPDAFLILQAVEEEAGAFSIDPLKHTLDATFNAAGVDSSRFAFSEIRDYTETRAVIRLADLYLEPLSSGTARWTAEALALGIPAIIRLEQTTGSNTLLDAAGVPQLVATSTVDYVTLAVTLGSDQPTRTQVALHIQDAVEKGVSFLDTLAGSDVFGRLITSAFDERASSDSSTFRRREILAAGDADTSATSALEDGFSALSRGDTYAALNYAEAALTANPADPKTRSLYGQTLIKNWETGRAIPYLLAAIQHLPGDTSIWLALADAFRTRSQFAEAIQSLEGCLRADGNCVDAWLLLSELAENAGSTELTRDALEALQKLAPDHPQVVALAQRFGL